MRRENAFLISGILGAGVGAGLMYLLDPERGNRRRALVRDQLVQAGNKTGDILQGTTADLANRSKGVVHELRRTVESEEVDERTLEARVRSQLGHLVSEPSKIEVKTEGQQVTLSGSAPQEEVDALVDGISSVPGVKEVRNRMQTEARAN